jgi:serine/threonine protein kinase
MPAHRTDDVGRLLLRWEASRRQGQPLSLDALCADQPHLRDELRRRLQALEVLAQALHAPGGPRAAPVASEVPDLSFLDPPSDPGELGWLAHYRVLKVLGVGGMGIVFAAEDTYLRRAVALKVMKSTAEARPMARQRFLREARAMAALQHEHVISIYQVGEHRGIPYLAMPLLEGETLQDRLDRPEPLSVAEITRIGREVAEALAAAHDRALIHRDIKPSNIWLERGRGRVKVLDFGLARPLGGDEQLTPTGFVVGTPSYMAPEQARGEDVDARCDLFALGTVLYEMCVREPPFQGEDTMALLLALTMRTPEAPHVRNPDVPPQLSELVMQLLAKEREDRPPTARVVAAALDAIRRAHTAAAGRTPTAEGAVDQATVLTTAPPSGPGQPAPPAPEPVLHAFLVVVAGPDRGRQFVLSAGESVQIGRSQNTASRLSDPAVSRLHCDIEWDGRSARITNVSKNGTFVNGVAVGHSVLKSGDLIRIGDTELAFSVGTWSGPDTAPTVTT